ncbi:hypothetical protein [Nocardioides sp.]|uniref:hypothetical protein n=1 Tax=Nocardioides sp. TaxID=35761 RepID=UPI00286E2359|nr:hypothetical protein [Nocardioides sp.]
MSDLTDEEAEAVGGWLDRHEFEKVSSRGEDSSPFGDRQDVWERDGTLVRLTRDRGQWWYDLSQDGTDVWLNVDAVAGASGSKATAPIDRVADVTGSIDDRVFSALSASLRHSP